MGSSTYKKLSQYWKNEQLDKAPKNYSHFGGTNNILALSYRLLYAFYYIIRSYQNVRVCLIFG